MGLFLIGVAVGVFLLFVICAMLVLVIFGSPRQYSWRKVPTLFRELACRYEQQETMRQYDRWLAALPATDALLKKLAG